MPTSAEMNKKGVLITGFPYPLSPISFPYRCLLCRLGQQHPIAPSWALVGFEMYSGTPLIQSPMGPKEIGPINEGFFYKKMYGGFCQAAKKRCP